MPGHWSQSAIYNAEAARLLTDPHLKAHFYSFAGLAKENEALLWNETTDREKKINAEKQMAYYHEEAAKLR